MLIVGGAGERAERRGSGEGAFLEGKRVKWLLYSVSLGVKFIGNPSVGIKTTNQVHQAP